MSEICIMFASVSEEYALFSRIYSVNNLFKVNIDIEQIVLVSGSEIERVSHVILFILCKIPQKVPFIAKSATREWYNKFPSENFPFA